MSINRLQRLVVSHFDHKNNWIISLHALQNITIHVYTMSFDGTDCHLPLAADLISVIRMVT